MSKFDEPMEETLDPQNWQEMRLLGHVMVDDMIEYLQSVRERAVWQPTNDALKNRFDQPIPTAPEGPLRAYEDFLKYVLPFPLGNIHPRFWGWVCGTGTPFAMLAEMLAAGMNSSLFGCDQAPVLVENQVLNWFKGIFGFPDDAGGILVSGGTMANLVGLVVARDSMAESDIAAQGMAAAPKKMVLYGSVEMHSSIERSLQLMGLGRDAVRRVPVDENYRIDIAALQAMIARDRAQGLQPFCLVANAGTVNTGAFDDIDRLADIAAQENLWLHVDGAFGAMAALSGSLQYLIKGLERADSLAFDLHKWFFMPYDAGCTLVRDREKHHRAFTSSANYLSQFNRGITAGAPWYSEYGLELSRGFRALKIWMSIKEQGIDKFVRLIDQNRAQASYLADLINAADDLELMAPAPLNIVCFRFVAADLDDRELDEINKELLWRLQESGVAVPSSTIIKGRFVIRVAITNHRSRRADFDLLVEKCTQFGQEIIADRRYADKLMVTNAK